jgi:hypothetical protein
MNQDTIDQIKNDLAVQYTYFNTRLDELKTDPNLELSPLIEFYRTVKEFHEHLKEYTVAVGKLQSNMQYTFIPEYLADRGMGTTTLSDLGCRISPTLRTLANVKPEMKERAKDWLNNNGYDYLVTETVNPQSLSTLAKELGKENRELPEEIFNTTIRNSISLTKTTQQGGPSDQSQRQF